jgi:hypothetical protein
MSKLPLRSAAVLAAVVLALTAALVAPVQASTTVSVHLRYAIKHLPVKAHSHAASYDRTADFGEWLDQGGGCDTRAVVLKAESLKATTQNASCTVEKGKWYSFYNAKYYYDAYGGMVQIDHVVPVENSWISGAWGWTKGTRVRYYNDLGDSRTLVAVDGSDNESKGDRDVTAWMPSHGHCRYVRYWVAVKVRWHLSVTSAEKAKLLSVADNCTNPVMHVRKATIYLK